MLIYFISSHYKVNMCSFFIFLTFPLIGKSSLPLEILTSKLLTNVSEVF